MLATAQPGGILRDKILIRKPSFQGFVKLSTLTVEG
jgi:hypothetical protein